MVPATKAGCGVGLAQALMNENPNPRGSQKHPDQYIVSVR